jgi:hypothetical protein
LIESFPQHGTQTPGDPLTDFNLGNGLFNVCSPTHARAQTMRVVTQEARLSNTKASSRKRIHITGALPSWTLMFKGNTGKR